MLALLGKRRCARLLRRPHRRAHLGCLGLIPRALEGRVARGGLDLRRILPALPLREYRGLQLLCRLFACRCQRRRHLRLGRRHQRRLHAGELIGGGLAQRAGQLVGGRLALLLHRLDRAHTLTLAQHTLLGCGLRELLFLRTVGRATCGRESRDELRVANLGLRGERLLLLLLRVLACLREPR